MIELSFGLFPFFKVSFSRIATQTFVCFHFFIFALHYRMRFEKRDVPANLGQLASIFYQFCIFYSFSIHQQYCRVLFCIHIRFCWKCVHFGSYFQNLNFFPIFMFCLDIRPGMAFSHSKSQDFYFFQLLIQPDRVRTQNREHTLEIFTFQFFWDSGSFIFSLKNFPFLDFYFSFLWEWPLLPLLLYFWENDLPNLEMALGKTGSLF